MGARSSTLGATSESSSRPRQQRPAYEELIWGWKVAQIHETSHSHSSTEAETSRENRDASSQQNVSAKKRFPKNSLSRDVHLFLSQVPKPARPLSPGEREDSIQKRQRPAEVNTVLMTAGVYNGNEIASWTEDKKTLHTATQHELLNMDKFGVADVVDRPPSQQVLSTRWEQKQRLDGFYKMRIVAKDFSRPSVPTHTSTQERQNSRRCDVCSTWLQSTDIQWHSENVTVLLIIHQSRANQIQCKSRAGAWSARRLFKVLRFRHRFGEYSHHKQNQRHGLWLVVSDPSTYVKKWTQRQDDSIFLRHMDDQRNTSWVIWNTWRPVCIWRMWWCCATK